MRRAFEAMSKLSPEERQAHLKASEAQLIQLLLRTRGQLLTVSSHLVTLSATGPCLNYKPPAP